MGLPWVSQGHVQVLLPLSSHSLAMFLRLGPQGGQHNHSEDRVAGMKSSGKKPWKNHQIELRMGWLNSLTGFTREIPGYFWRDWIFSEFLRTSCNQCSTGICSDAFRIQWSNDLRWIEGMKYWWTMRGNVESRIPWRSLLSYRGRPSVRKYERNPGWGWWVCLIFNILNIWNKPSYHLSPRIAVYHYLSLVADRFKLAILRNPVKFQPWYRTQPSGFITRFIACWSVWT